jgi:putative hydrolase of the HAD superfamily
LLRAITLDYWDTLVVGASVPERVNRRRDAMYALVRSLGATLSAEQFGTYYVASAEEAHRWWKDHHRGYSTQDRIHWLIRALQLPAPPDPSVVDAAAAEVDQTLLDFPAPLLPHAREALQRLAAKFKLAIVSDTGFASGKAQDRLLEQHGVRDHFHATVYSMDVGHAKPRPEIFRAALDALGVEPGETLHVGDNEHTDVAGALAMGMRAVRADIVRESGPSRAERVVKSLPELVAALT